MDKDYTEDWTDRQREFFHCLTKIIENGTYTETMHGLIYSWWKAEKAQNNVTDDKEALAWSQAWDVLRELNLKIGKGIDTKFPVLNDVMERFNIHSQVKGDSWQTLELGHLLDQFSKECEEFWDSCGNPDVPVPSYSEMIDVLLVALMIATRLKQGVSDG